MKLPLLFALSMIVTILADSESSAMKTPVDTLADDNQKNHLSVNVVNNTDYDVEQLIHWACNYLGIKSVTICVAYQRNIFEEEGVLVKHGNMYFIYLKKRLISFNTIITHELVHVKQYEEKDLVRINPHTISYKGNVMNLHRIDYFQRPFELEAHSEDSKIVRKYFKHQRVLRRELRKENGAAPEENCTFALTEVKN